MLESISCLNFECLKTSEVKDGSFDVKTAHGSTRNITDLRAPLLSVTSLQKLYSDMFKSSMMHDLETFCRFSVFHKHNADEISISLRVFDFMEVKSEPT